MSKTIFVIGGSAIVGLLYYRARMNQATAPATDTTTPPDATLTIANPAQSFCGEAIYRPGVLQNPDTRPGAWPGLNPPPQEPPPVRVLSVGPISQEPPPIVATPLPLRVPITSPPIPKPVTTDIFVTSPPITSPLFRPLLPGVMPVSSSVASPASDTAPPVSIRNKPATSIRETPMDIFLP